MTLWLHAVRLTVFVSILLVYGIMCNTSFFRKSGNFKVESASLGYRSIYIVGISIFLLAMKNS